MHGQRLSEVIEIVRDEAETKGKELSMDQRMLSPAERFHALKKPSFNVTTFCRWGIGDVIHNVHFLKKPLFQHHLSHR